MKLVATAIGAAVVAAGCAPLVWNKPGASRDDFSRDRYTCLQESQQRVAGATVNQFGGAALNTVATNPGLFEACMNSNGWYVGQQQSVQPTQAAATIGGSAGSGFKPPPTPVDVELRQLTIQAEARSASRCHNQAYAPLFTKGACKVGEITAAQLSDASRATASEKILLKQIMDEGADSMAHLTSAYRTAGRPHDLEMASGLDGVRGRSDRNITALIDGKITWGEYNRTRRENARLGAEDRKRLEGK